MGLLSLLGGMFEGGSQQPIQQTVAPQPVVTNAPQGLGANDTSNAFNFTNVNPSASVPTAQSGTPDPITVVGHRTQPNYNAGPYNNTQEVSALHNTINQYQPNQSPDGNYGGIPGNLGVHGTLGKLLGTLGDAFLVGSGRQPMHLVQAQQQELGNAMVGASQDPFAAADRVAATGVPGAAEQSQKLIQEGNEAKLRQQMQEQNNSYRQSLIQNRNDQATQRMLPYIGNLAQNAKTPQDYQRVYSQADAIAKRLDPNADPGTAFGLVSPEEWQPGMNAGAGITAGQQLRANTSQRGQDMTQQNARINAGSRIGAARISAGARENTSQSAYEQSLVDKQNSGQQLTPAEQQYWNHYTSQPKNALKNQLSVPIAMAGANNPVANGGRPITPQQAATLPKGTHFLTNDGRWLVR